MRQVFADDNFVVSEGDNYQLIELKKGNELTFHRYDPLDFTIMETVTLKGKSFLLTKEMKGE